MIFACCLSQILTNIRYAAEFYSSFSSFFDHLIVNQFQTGKRWGNAGVISPNEAIEFAKANVIQVYTIGLGSETPTMIGRDAFGRPAYAELDENTLKAIAKQTGGTYFKSIDKGTLDEIYETIGKDIEREKEEVYIKEWFFASALALLLAQIYLRYGKGKIIQ